MLKTLRRKLILLCTLITAAILTLMSLVALGIFEKHFRTQNHLALENHLDSLIFCLQTENTISDAYLAEMEVTNDLIILIEDQGQPLLFKGAHLSQPLRDTLIEETKALAVSKYHFNLTPLYTSGLDFPKLTFEFTSINKMHLLTALAVFSTNNGRCNVILISNMKKADTYIFKIRLLFLLFTVVGISLLALFSFWFSNHAIIPIEASQKKQVEFIAAASHELRSPLAVLQTSIAALDYEPDSQNANFVDISNKECIRMKRLIDDLLLLSNCDAHSWSIMPSELDVDTLLIETYDLFVALSQQKKVFFSLNLPDNLLPSLFADGERLRQAITILLDNAFSYTPSGGKVQLVASTSSSILTIQVIDNGIGIPDEHKALIFERFYRVDTSRHAKEHYGLGLSIAYELIQLHHGQLLLENTSGGGCTFSICLPLRKDIILT